MGRYVGGTIGKGLLSRVCLTVNGSVYLPFPLCNLSSASVASGSTGESFTWSNNFQWRVQMEQPPISGLSVYTVACNYQAALWKCSLSFPSKILVWSN